MTQHNRYTLVTQEAARLRRQKDNEYRTRYLEAMVNRDSYYTLLCKDLKEMFAYLSRHQYHKK